MKILSEKMLGILERLAEMFPKQQYQSCLEQYILSKHPQSASDVEYWSREYNHNKNFYWCRGL